MPSRVPSGAKLRRRCLPSGQATPNVEGRSRDSSCWNRNGKRRARRVEGMQHLSATGVKLLGDPSSQSVAQKSHDRQIRSNYFFAENRCPYYELRLRPGAKQFVDDLGQFPELGVALEGL